MVAHNLTRPGLLEPFGRTLMCLQLRHLDFPGLNWGYGLTFIV
jgi:hypothetical protein